MEYVCDESVFCFQAEDGIRDLVRSRGLGDVYKRQVFKETLMAADGAERQARRQPQLRQRDDARVDGQICLLYTSDAADERSSVDLGGRRIIKKKKHQEAGVSTLINTTSTTKTTGATTSTT